MIVRISCELDASADRAWTALKQPWSFRYVTRGLLGLRSAQPLPDQWPLRGTVRARLMFFHVVPAWIHELRFVHIDDSRREMLSNERGGPVRMWNHRISVAPVAMERCRYTDEIEIEAGWLTLVVGFFAQGFYRYRQMRWRYLARRLSALPTRPEQA